MVTGYYSCCYIVQRIFAIIYCVLIWYDNYSFYIVVIEQFSS